MTTSKLKKLSLSPRPQATKREHEDEELLKKRAKSDNLNLLIDSNFLRACELVSKKIDEDKLNRFLLPNCLQSFNKRNSINLTQRNEIQPHAAETFQIEMRSNKWYEALEVSFLSITPTQYLSGSVLKNIVEIMMNAHEDPSSEYHMSYLIDKCQQVLSLNFKLHPPSLLNLSECYYYFLTSPMDLREETLTNRKENGSESGILKYCVNRLLNEFSTDSKDGPFFNKEEVIPEHIQQEIQEMHWVKSRLEIFEMLNRTDRIDRLMAVMDSMAELLGFDLAIWQSRQGDEFRRSKRHQKLLMTQVLAPTTKSANAINDTCIKIMKIFVYFVHLNYPDKYIKTMSIWLNILAECLHIIGNPLYNDISDFYKPGKNSATFAKEFYEIIADLPPESIYRILERVTPAHLKYSIAILHARKLSSDNNKENIIKILINFMRKCQWNDFPETTTELKSNGKEMSKSITSDNILKQLAMICKYHNKSCSDYKVYLKFEDDHGGDFVIDRNYLMRILYITFRAYLYTYKVYRFQKTLLQLNNESNENKLQDNKEQPYNKHHFKSIMQFITMYRDIYTDLKEYFNLIKSLKTKNELPKDFYIFEKVIDLN